MQPPVVFISYSHDSQEHKKWVLELAIRLRQSGVDAILDQFELGPGADLPHFMESSISRSARILMVCTERYVDKADAGKGGVGYEKMIVTADLLKQIGSNRVIPIVRQNGSARMPVALSTKFYIDMSSADVYESGMDQLLRELLGAPLFKKPPIGSAPFNPVDGGVKPLSAPPVDRLMAAVAKVYDRSDSSGLLRTEWVRDAMGVSKMLFDHALDVSESLDYLHCSTDRQLVWVLQAGRAAILKLSDGG